jgi:hypothetical protein
VEPCRVPCFERACRAVAVFEKLDVSNLISPQKRAKRIWLLRWSSFRSEGILALTAVRVDPNHIAKVIQATGSRATPAAVANSAHRCVNLVVDGR